MPNKASNNETAAVNGNNLYFLNINGIRFIRIIMLPIIMFWGISSIILVSLQNLLLIL